MKKRINRALALTSLRATHRQACWGFCILMLVGIVLVGDVSASGFAVVVNKSNNADNVSLSDLMKYFRAETQFWPNGKKVVILLREAGSEEKKVLLDKVYKQSEDELKKMWVGKVYKNEIASPPKTVSSPSALIKAVMDTEGGIGIVKAEEASGDVKVLKIDGKLPNDAGYPLK